MPAKSDRGLESLRALAVGEISLDEARDNIKRDAVDAVDLILSLVAQAQRRSSRSSPEHLSARMHRFAEPPSRASGQDIVHKVPLLPVLLNGTLLDPQDIVRYNGTELHFMYVEDQLLAFDDRALVARWWETAYVLSILDRRHEAVGQAGRPEPRDVPPFPPLDPGIPDPSTPYSPGGGIPDTQFFEHINGGGDVLYLRRDRGYADLTEVGRGFLGFGDWNDVITSVKLGNVQIAVLYEHIHYQGSTFSINHGGTVNLTTVGWNDRASSVGTW